MERLCERPGCSDLASVSYGMRAADLVFWLDTLSDGDDPSHGVLCRRHADSMIVPRNWTLDDIRDPDLHLFRPPPPTENERPPRRRAARRRTGDQLELAIDDEGPAGGGDESARPAAPSTGDNGAAPDDEAGTTPAGDGPADGPGGHATPEPWTPAAFDNDDLDGLLAARGPLLARAFRGADRPRTT